MPPTYGRSLTPASPLTTRSQEFGPTAIAKALGGKSSGAVSNALDKLIADGTAVKTNEKPRRFTLAPAEQAATPVPTN